MGFMVLSQDPMALGIAASLARPGGNVTGFWLEGDEAHLKGDIAAVAPAQFVQPLHKGSEPVARDRRSRCASTRPSG